MILRPSTPRLRLVGALAVAALVGACSERPSKAPADASSDADANADAEADAGAAPDIGGGDGSDDAGWQPTCPGGIGCACDDPTDCDASLCLETAAGLRCSNFCGDGVCPPGWACEGSKGGVDSLYFCVPGGGLMCRPCTTDTECQASGHAGARCVSYGDAGGFCGVGCQGDGDCQAGHACRDVTSVQGGSTSKQCVVAGKAPATLGACTCSKHAIDKSLQTTCFVQTGAGATARRCLGSRACGPGGLSTCAPFTGAAASCVEAQCLDVATQTPLADGKICDDGRACTKGDTCKQGLCLSGTSICECEPGLKDCPAPSASDASNACKGPPYCEAQASGAAVPFLCRPNPGQTKVCDASLDSACSKNACVPLSGACTPTAIEWTQEICDLPANAEGKPGCRREALPPTATAAPASACDDGLLCSTGDACQAGVCKPAQTVECKCKADSDCEDDGDKCNGLPYCDKSGPTWSCKVNPASLVQCDTSSDSPCMPTACVPATGACKKAPGPAGKTCSDEIACTEGDICDGAGACKPGTWVCCKKDQDCLDPASKLYGDDGDKCNGLPFCNLQTGACQINPATVVSCPNALDTACNKTACDKASGACVVTLADPVSKTACDDGQPCTGGDLCGPAGVCAGAIYSCPCKADADCKGKDDGDLCNGTLYCDPSDGHCKPNPATVVVCQTVDDTACAKTQCQKKTGSCAALALPAAATCDADGSYCTANDACDGKGACLPGTSICQCQQDADCAVHEDGNLCDGTLYCDKTDPKAPACKVNPKTLVTCPSVDDTLCSKTTCQAKSGACQAVWAADGTPCGGGKSCKEGACQGGSALCAGVAYANAQVGGAGNDGLQGLAQGNDGALLAVGTAAGKDPWVVRLDAAGNVLGEAKVGLGKGIGLLDVEAHADGGYVAVGQGGSVGNAEGIYVRLDAAGAVISWVVSAAGQGLDLFDSVAVAGDGSAYVTGVTESKGAGKRDLWALRYDAAGKALFDVAFGGGSDDQGHDALALAGGGALLAGATWRHLGAEAKDPDAWLLWLDAKGQVVRDRRYGDVGHESALGVALAPAVAGLPAGFLVVGEVAGQGDAGDLDALVLRLDADGGVQWQRSIAASSGYDALVGLAVDGGGGLLASGSQGGTLANPETGGAVWVVRLDPFGNDVFSRQLAGPPALRGLGPLRLLAKGSKGGAGWMTVGQAFGPGNWQGLVVRGDALGFPSCAAAGLCAGKAADACDDANSCTQDVCDPTAGACTQSAHSGACAAQQCSVGDACSAGACKAGAKAKLWSTAVPGTGKWLSTVALVAHGAGGVVALLDGGAGAGSRVMARNAAGDIAWTTMMATTSAGKDLQLAALARFPDGRLLVGGNYQEPGGARRFSAILDPAGKVKLEVAEGIDGAGTAVIARGDGGFWLGGYSGSAFGTAKGSQSYVARYQPDGKLTFAKGHGGDAHDAIYGLVEHPNGGLVAAGKADTTSGWALRLDANGDISAEATFTDGGTGTLFRHVAATGDGGWIFAGSVSGKGGSDGWLVRTDSQFGKLFELRQDLGKADFYNHVTELADGTLLVAATSAPSGVPQLANGHALLRRLSPKGAALTTWAFDDGGWHATNAALVLADGSYVVGGEYGGGSAFYGWIARVDPWGHKTCVDAGVCSSIATPSCQDGNPCTDEGCDAKAGCTQAKASCDDSDPCTADSCDAQQGCQQKPIADNQGCGVFKVCQSGACVSGPPANCLDASVCDDSNLCTDDTCDVAKGCLNTPNAKACDDGKLCTHDACAGGKCVGTLARAFHVAGSGLAADKMYGVAAASDAGWFAAGVRADAKQGWLMRFGPNGNVQWDKNYPTANGERAFLAVAANADGSSVAAGYTFAGDTNYDGHLTRIGGGGTESTSVSFQAPGPARFTAIVTVASGHVAVGSSGPTSGAGQDAWALATDKQGQKLWEHSSGVGKEDGFASVAALAGGAVVAAGDALDPSNNRQGAARWFDAAGKVLRERRYGADTHHRFSAVTPAAAGDGLPEGLLFAGLVHQAPGNTDGWVVRTDGQGVQLWQIKLASTTKNDALSGVAAWEGGIAIGGLRNHVDGSNVGATGWLGRLDALGNLQWERAIAGDGSIQFLGNLVAAPAGHPGGAGLLMAGQHDAAGKDQQGIVVRSDAFGHVDCTVAGKCAGTPAKGCDDNKACTADDCSTTDGTCKHTNHTGSCDGKACTVGDACLDGACNPGAKPKLWEKIYPSDSGASLWSADLVPSLDGGAFFALEGLEGAQSKVLRLDHKGDVLWDNDKPDNQGKKTSYRGVAAGGDGTFAAVGNVDADQYIRVFRNDGSVQFEAKTNPGHLSSAVWHAGTFWAVGVYQQNGSIVKYDGSGSSLENKEFGGKDLDQFEAAASDAGAGITACGTTKSAGAGGFDAWIVKVGMDAHAMLDTKWGGPADDHCNDIAAATGGGWAFVGETASLGKGGIDGFAVRMSPAGAVLWQRMFGTVGDESMSSVALMADGSWLLGGHATYEDVAPNFDGQGWLLRVDALGNTLWEQKLGGPKWEHIDGVAALGDGSVLALGSRHNGTTYDGWLMRTDAWALGGTCSKAGLCASLAPTLCDDNDPCTLDGCEAQAGCTHKPATNDWLCATGKVCDKGACVVGLAPKCLDAKACDDGNTCTDDACDQAKGCSYTAVSAPCDDGYACTSGEACKDGVCTATAPVPSLWTGGSAQSDELYGVAAAADGGAWAVGFRENAAKAWALRTDAAGKVLWDKALDETGEQVLRNVAPDANGGAVAVGYTGSAANWNAWFVRLDASGAVLGQKTHGGALEDRFYALAPVGNEYYVAGFTAEASAGGTDAWVLRLDGLGNLLWQHTFGAASADYAVAVLTRSDGGAVAIGNVGKATTPSVLDQWMVWIDAAGKIERQRLLGAPEHGRLDGIAIAPATGLWSAGYVMVGARGKAADAMDGWIGRTDDQGALLWHSSLAATAGHDLCYGVVPFADGGAFAACSTGFGPATGGALLTFRLDGSGNVQWQRKVESPTEGSLHSFSNAVARLDGSGALTGMMFAGQDVPGGGSGQGVVVRTDPWGHVSCVGAGKCALIAPAKCDDANPCTADDCTPSDGACSNTNHSGACFGNSCSTGDFCGGGVCKAGAKAKLWEKAIDGGNNPLYLNNVASNGADGFVAALGGTGGVASQVIAYTAAGDVAWQKPLSNPAGAIAMTLNGIDWLPDGRYVLAGTWFAGPASPRRYTALLSADGQTLKPFAESIPCDGQGVAARPDGGYFVAGRTDQFGAGGYAAYFSRHDGNGGLLWQQFYGGAGDEAFHSVIAIPGGGAIGVGDTTAAAGGLGDGYVVQVGADGATQWSHKFGSPQHDWFIRIVDAPKGGYVIAGNSDGLGAGLYDAWLVRLDVDGAKLWDKTYGAATTNEFANGVTALPDGGFLFGGTVAPGPKAVVDPNSTPGTAWFVRTDASGNQLWQSKVAGVPNWNSADRVLALPNGSFAVGGYRGIAGNFDAWVGVIDSWGNPSCALSGTCVSIPFGSCKDIGPCDTATCDPKKGCAALPKDDGTACDDGKPCSVQDQCFFGVCEPGKDGLWDKPFGTAKADRFTGVAARADGTTVAAGRTHNTSGGNANGWLVAAGLAGETLWSKVVSATQWSGLASESVVFYDVTALSDGGALAAGQYIPASPGTTSAALLYRVDTKGEKVKAAPFVTAGGTYFAATVVKDNTVWAAGRSGQNGGDGWVQALALDTLTPGSAHAIVGGQGSDWFNSINLAAAGGTLSAGAKTIDSATVGWAVRVNASGVVLWDKEFALNGPTVFYRALPAPSGGFLLLGQTEQAGGGAASADMAMVRVSAGGTALWQSTPASVGYDAAFAGVPWGDGWLVAGDHTPGGNGIDGRLLFVNGQGGFAMLKTWGGGNADQLHAMVLAGSSLVVAGTTASKGAGVEDGWLMRVDPSGNASCGASGPCLADMAKCDDKNACTVDTCSAAGGCGAVKLPDGAACGTGLACKAGVCGP